jgi:hypothetical protein
MGRRIPRYLAGALAAMLCFAVCGGSGLLFGRYTTGTEVAGYAAMLAICALFFALDGFDDPPGLGIVVVTVALLSVALSVALANGLLPGQRNRVDGTIMEVDCRSTEDTACQIEYRVSVTATEQDLGWFQCADRPPWRAGDHATVTVDPGGWFKPTLTDCESPLLARIVTGAYLVVGLAVPLLYLGIRLIRARRRRERTD